MRSQGRSSLRSAQDAIGLSRPTGLVALGSGRFGVAVKPWRSAARSEVPELGKPGIGKAVTDGIALAWIGRAPIGAAVEE